MVISPITTRQSDVRTTLIGLHSPAFHLHAYTLLNRLQVPDVRFTLFVVTFVEPLQRTFPDNQIRGLVSDKAFPLLLICEVEISQRAEQRLEEWLKLR
jgi:hypothetical protein